jgi:MFS transporter, DHA1 family, multidrug resistance protein
LGKPPKDRGVAVSVYAAAAFIGPIFGPIVGGFIIDSSLGWRWTSWITLILATAFGIASLILVPETYGPLILQRRAARLRREIGNWALHAALDENVPTLKDIVFKYFLRPCKMLVKEPILLLVTIYISLIYGILYLFFVAYELFIGEDWPSESSENCGASKFICSNNHVETKRTFLITKGKLFQIYMKYLRR